jgi:hypothetical protein
VHYLIEAILRIVWWPYDAWRQSNENSRIGVSELDREAERFWKRIAMTITVLLVLGGLLVLGLAAYIFRKG